MDRVTQYAIDVVAGREIASRLVIAACRRHLTDQQTATARGLVWRDDKAGKAIDFFEEVLFLPENKDVGEYAAVQDDADDGTPRPFILQPWQAFIVGSLFGWYTVKGFRRFREAYIETAKGSGKTPLGAGMMLYLLVADGQKGAQVFLAAVTREQANIAWRDALAMVDASPELQALVWPGRRANYIEVVEDKSFLRPVSSEKRGLDGKRVHGALIDELHEQPAPIVVNKMRAGTKGDQNALIVKATNSGFDRTSVCWHHHEHSRQVLDGTVTNDAWFAFICGLDPCDACVAQGKWFPSEDCSTCDDWKTEGQHWRKANPNLGIALAWQYLRERVDQAKSMASEVSDVLRFNFCVWTQGANRAIDMGRWNACQPMPSESELLSAECFGILDMGETDDFTAAGRLWLLDDGRVAVKLRYFLPSAALAKYPNRPYDQWRRSGLLEITDGEVTDYSFVRARLSRDGHASGVKSIFYDRRSATETAQIMMGEFDMVPIIQGFALDEAIKRFLGLVATGQLCHDSDPILAWMASNTVVLKGSKGERRLDKVRSPEKIDGIAAVLCGVEGAIVRRERKATPQFQMMVLPGVR